MTDPPHSDDATRDVPVWRVGPPRPGADETRHRVVTERVVDLALNGRTVVRATVLPDRLEDFAVGFLAAEGLVSGAASIHDLAVSADATRIDVGADVDPDRLVAFRERLAISTGCGGGAASTADALPRCASPARFRADDLLDRMGEFADASPLFRETGGVHAAAVTDGRTLDAFAEDLGRASAVDKALGRCLRTGLALADRALLTTGRASADILAKAARVGLPVVVSRGAVTSRAIDLAAAADVALAGFARSRRMNVYTAPWRLGIQT